MVFVYLICFVLVLNFLFVFSANRIVMDLLYPIIVRDSWDVSTFPLIL